MSTITETLLPLSASNFIPGVDGVTTLPITQGEDGEHYGYGHINSVEFAEAANAIDEALGCEVLPEEKWKPEDVQYRYGVTTFHQDGEWAVNWVEEGTPNSFALTVLV
jgi:hypothetical protein